MLQPRKIARAAAQQRGKGSNQASKRPAIEAHKARSATMQPELEGVMPPSSGSHEEEREEASAARRRLKEATPVRIGTAWATADCRRHQHCQKVATV